MHLPERLQLTLVMAPQASIRISNLKEGWFCYDAAKLTRGEVCPFLLWDDTSILSATAFSAERTLSTLYFTVKHFSLVVVTRYMEKSCVILICIQTNIQKCCVHIGTLF